MLARSKKVRLATMTIASVLFCRSLPSSPLTLPPLPSSPLHRPSWRRGGDREVAASLPSLLAARGRTVKRSARSPCSQRRGGGGGPHGATTRSHPLLAARRSRLLRSVRLAAGGDRRRRRAQSSALVRMDARASCASSRRTACPPAPGIVPPAPCARSPR